MSQPVGSRNVLASAIARDAGIKIPGICGARYPCNSPELVGAASETGAIATVQPNALAHVPRYRSALAPTDAPYDENTALFQRWRRGNLLHWADVRRG